MQPFSSVVSAPFFVYGADQQGRDFSKVLPAGWGHKAWQPVLTEVVDVLSKRFGSDIQVGSIVQLTSEDRRNKVLRITLQNPGNWVPKSVIFKQSITEQAHETDKQAFDRFARDWAGLEFLNETAHTPKFYGGSQDHRFVLVEDLGKHVSLVDSLTGSDPRAAIVALERYVRRVGQFHADSFGKLDRYFEILHRINPAASSCVQGLELTHEGAISKIESLLRRIDILSINNLQKEVEAVFKGAREPGPFTTFIHGDICHDNVFDDPLKNELRLIDFEFSWVRSALLDGTYLRMCMPTGWFAYRVPEDQMGSLETIYRQELMKHIPAARDDSAYAKAYTEACAYWMITQAVLYIENTLDNPQDQKLAEWEQPRVLSRLQAFIDVSQEYNQLPGLRSMAVDVLRVLKDKWPDAKPLDLYPAFS